MPGISLTVCLVSLSHRKFTPLSIRCFSDDTGINHNLNQKCLTWIHHSIGQHFLQFPFLNTDFYSPFSTDITFDINGKQTGSYTMHSTLTEHFFCYVLST